MFWSTRLALKYLYSPKDKWISVSAILASMGLCLGVMTLIVILAVMQGFRDKLLEKTLQNQGHVVINGQIPNYMQITQHLQTMPEVQSAVPLLEKQFVCMYNKQSFGVLARGMHSEQIKTNTKHTLNINEIIIGKQLANETGIKINDNILLLSAESLETPFGSSPRMQSFKVIDTIETGFQQFDRIICIMTLQSIQEFLDLDNIASSIQIFLKDPTKAQDFKNKLNTPNAISWEEANFTFFQVLTVQKNIMFIVISLMIIIASFNGVSSLLLLVKEKTKEIAILKILGATKTQILSVFLKIGMIIGGSSIALGVLFGQIILKYINELRYFLEKLLKTELFPENFYHMTAIPINISIMQIAYIILWCLLITLLSLTYPCYKALKVEPDAELRI